MAWVPFLKREAPRAGASPTPPHLGDYMSLGMGKARCERLDDWAETI